MITWEKKYELGIASIDEQHKVLVEIISELSELLEQAQQGDDVYDDMMRIVSSLTDYTVKHFRYEEEIFARVGFEFMEKHMAEHKVLIDEIDSLDLRAIDEDQVTYGKKLLKHLITWLFKHISGSDSLYKELFIAKGIV